MKWEYIWVIFFTKLYLNFRKGNVILISFPFGKKVRWLRMSWKQAVIFTYTFSVLLST